jgi:hypothetical protein
MSHALAHTTALSIVPNAPAPMRTRVPKLFASEMLTRAVLRGPIASVTHTLTTTSTSSHCVRDVGQQFVRQQLVHRHTVTARAAPRVRLRRVGGNRRQEVVEHELTLSTTYVNARAHHRYAYRPDVRKHVVHTTIVTA